MKNDADDFRQALEDAQSVDLVLSCDSVGYMVVLHDTTKDNITFANDKIFVNTPTYSIYFPISNLAYYPKDDRWLVAVGDTVLGFILNSWEDTDDQNYD